MKYFKYLFLTLLFLQFSCKEEESVPVVSQSVFNSFEAKSISESKVFAKPKSLKNLKTDNALTLVSWNIRDLGGSKNDNEIHQIALILRDYDIVAIQEVVAKDPKGAQAVARLADELNRMGSKWDYRISNPTQSPSVYKSERYAFLWRTSKVQLLKSPYLDSELSSVCDREPYIGLFKPKTEGDQFYIINFHSRRFDAHPEEEIKHFIKYVQRLQTGRMIIAGDFNLDETHNVWDDFYTQGFKNALTKTKTTLKIKCQFGVYKNHAIDNIYVSEDISMLQSGSIDIVQDCNLLEMARSLSDHLPVYIEFQ